ncbi:unnamed protein product [Thlaspi arvense]|uniref:Uncharacterized protein n=1 Tax=Thlaspi arvense TaxID=13288 RepID=A0AAU9T4W1_THLAR|nr:unnamed protein product [Thlaspi arvense]
MEVGTSFLLQSLLHQRIVSIGRSANVSSVGFGRSAVYQGHLFRYRSVVESRPVIGLWVSHFSCIKVGHIKVGRLLVIGQPLNVDRLLVIGQPLSVGWLVSIGRLSDRSIKYNCLEVGRPISLVVWDRLMGRTHLPRGVQPRTAGRPDTVAIILNGLRPASPPGSIDSTCFTGGSGSPSSSAETRSGPDGSDAVVDTPMASRVTGRVGNVSSERVVSARPDEGSPEPWSPLQSSGREFPRSKSSARSLEDIWDACGVADLEFRVPGTNEHPWTPPPGRIFHYEFWFEHCQLWFPLPKLLLDYCEAREIALTQLCLGAIRNMVGAILVTESCNVEMSLRFFEEISNVGWYTRRAQQTVAVNMRSGNKVVTSIAKKSHRWWGRYFYARVNSALVCGGDNRTFVDQWSPEFVLHPVGEERPVDFEEDLAKIRQLGVLHWSTIVEARRDRNSFRRDRKDGEAIVECSQVLWLESSAGILWRCGRLVFVGQEAGRAGSERREEQVVSDSFRAGKEASGKTVGTPGEAVDVVGGPSKVVEDVRDYSFSYRYDGTDLFASDSDACVDLYRKVSHSHREYPPYNADAFGAKIYRAIAMTVSTNQLDFLLRREMRKLGDELDVSAVEKQKAAEREAAAAGEKLKAAEKRVLEEEKLKASRDEVEDYKERWEKVKDHYRNLKLDLARIRKERDDGTMAERRRVLSLVIPQFRDQVGKFERFYRSNEVVHTAVSTYTMASGVFDAFTSRVSDKTHLPKGTMAKLESERDTAKAKALALGAEDIQDEDFVVGLVSDWMALLASPSPVEAPADQYGSMSAGLASIDVSSLRSPGRNPALLNLGARLGSAHPV